MYKVTNISQQMIPLIVNGTQHNIVPNDHLMVATKTQQIANLSNPLRQMLKVQII